MRCAREQMSACPAGLSDRPLIDGHRLDEHEDVATDGQRQFVDGLAGERHHQPGAVLEFGLGQHVAVSMILQEYGYTDIALRKDLRGVIRAARGTKK